MAILPTGNERFEAFATVAAIDHNGVVRQRTKTFTYSEGVTTYVDAGLALAALLADLDAANEGDVIAYGIRAIWDNASTGDVTAVGEVYNEALLTLAIDGTPKKASHSLYSPIDAMVSGSSVVLSNAALLAYLAHFQTGGDFTVSDGETIPTTNFLVKGRVRRVSSGKSF